MTQDPTATPPDLSELPELPEPVDDGAADHLPGMRVPSVALPATDGRTIRVDAPPGGAGRLVLYCYPRTGRPGEAPLTADWDSIPGARGCTPESCGFRDHAAELRAAGADVLGLSTQDTEYQREMVQRLRLPFPVLSDAGLELTTAMRLPTFTAAGQVLLRRITLVLRDGRVEHVFYPVFPPDTHAERVLGWLRAHPAGPDVPS